MHNLSLYENDIFRHVQMHVTVFHQQIQMCYPERTLVILSANLSS